MSLGVRTYPFNLPRRLDAPVLTDVKMIPHTVETTAAVAHLQIFFREIPVRPSGGTVDHNQVNLPHRPALSFVFLFSSYGRKTGFPMQSPKSCQS